MAGSKTKYVPPTPSKPVGNFDYPDPPPGGRVGNPATVFAFVAAKNDTFTLSITSGTPLFKYPRILVSDLILVDQTVSPAPYPVYVWQRQNSIVNIGSSPSMAKKGQLVEVQVGIDTHNQSIPGLHQGEATLQGASSTTLVPLRVTLIGVDLTSPIGKRWLALGGANFLGGPLANTEISPNGNGLIQRFEAGVLYQTNAVYFANAGGSQSVSTTKLKQQARLGAGSSTLPMGKGPTIKRRPSSPTGKPLPSSFSPAAALKEGLASASQNLVASPSSRFTKIPRDSAGHGGSTPAVDPSYYGSVVFLLSYSIFAKFASLAGVTNWQGQPLWNELQFPTEDTFTTEEGGQALRFQGGLIVVRPDSRAFVVYGAIYAHYQNMGDLSSIDSSRIPFLGWPISEDEGVGRTRRSRFDNGDIYWAKNLPASEVHGPIRDHWMSIGGLDSVVGLPITDEKGTADGRGRYNNFEKGVIYWSPDTGAFEVHGEILTLWRLLGAETSYLGYPLSDVLPGSLPTQLYGVNYVTFFKNGQILWTQNAGAIDEPNWYQPPSQSVITPAGTALGGTVTITLWSNGDYRFLFEMRDTGFPDYDFEVHAIFTTPFGFSLACGYKDHIEGSISTGLDGTPPKSRLTWDENGSDARIQQYWPDIGSGALWLTKDYSATGVVGALEDVAKAIFDVGNYGLGAGVGVFIGIGSLVGQALHDIGVGGTIGILAGTAYFMFEGGLILATVAGLGVAVVTNLLIKHRDFPQEIYDEAVSLVFSNTLPPISSLRLTNLKGLNGRNFTMVGFDKLIYISIGDFYDDPWPVAKAGEDSRKLDARQTVIHELTHAWQLQHSSFLPGTLCDAIHTSSDNLVGESVYQYGPPGSPWDKFTDEAQAKLVQEWYAGIANVNAPYRTPCNENDPYFGYIRDIIRNP